jgi:hypothetical protein
MRLKPPALYYMVVERLRNRRVTLRRDEADGGYQLMLENCLSKQDAEERLAEAEQSGCPIELRRGRILVTRIAVSGEALGAICTLYHYQEKSAAKRQQERNRRQQIIVSRLTALEEAALNAELRAPVPPVAPAPPAAPLPTAKPPRTPRAKKGGQ